MKVLVDSGSGSASNGPSVSRRSNLDMSVSLDVVRRSPDPAESLKDWVAVRAKLGRKKYLHEYVSC